MKLYTKALIRHPWTEGGLLKMDDYHLQKRIDWQRINFICRNNSYSNDVACFPVLVNNIVFPNFKEELDV